MISALQYQSNTLLNCSQKLRERYHKEPGPLQILVIDQPFVSWRELVLSIQNPAVSYLFVGMGIILFRVILCCENLHILGKIFAGKSNFGNGHTLGKA